ncbi:WD40 repeat-containing protein [Desarmillaria tabescens]|uniref:WD40 repeat-containing protein n=1 Tax=Armillaria tabescens TaxID=1929756 RepID=A0AA39NGV6_ARMTA|nr:WD40 repeat-containing protein [Desarmillaria tabescens]KAK0465399.1 WD40 repeat-containing protein [Desarmillaria tabescens]
MSMPDKSSSSASSSQQPAPFYPRLSLNGHTKSISSLKFSPDGSILASSGADRIIKLWDAYTGEILRTLSGHDQGISDIAWSPDGEFLASASDDKTIKIWSMDQGVEVKTLTGHTNFVFAVNYNPHSNLLVSGGFDETVRVWDVARGTCMKVLPAHSDPVTSVSFNHDGTLIVSCAMDGLMSVLWLDWFFPSISITSCRRIWDVDSGQCLKTLVDDDNPICSHVEFSPNSKFVLVSTQDSTIRLWNYQTSRCVKTYSGHVNRTYCLFSCFSHTKHKYIVSGSEDHKAYIWDLQTRQVLQTLEGHRGESNTSVCPSSEFLLALDVVLAVATHPTKDIIATSSMEKDLAIRLWVRKDEDPDINQSQR